MMKITIDDLKRLNEIYEPIIDRADKLVDLQSKLDGNRLTVMDIYEITKEQIGFRCEDRWGDNEYIYFLFEDFVSENYFERYEKQYKEEQEKKRIKEEEKKKQRALEIEKQERETLEKLKAKYPELKG